MKKRPIVYLLLFILAVGACVALTGCRPKETRGVSYRISVDFDDAGHRYDAVEEARYRNGTGDALAEIVLNFFPNAYTEGQKLPVTEENLAAAYPYGVNYAVTELTAVDCSAMRSYSLAGNQLIVRLSQPLAPGDELAITLKYGVTLPANTMRFGFNETAVNLTNFYFQFCPYADGTWRSGAFSPFGDPIFAETADYEVEFNLPENYNYVCSGISEIERVGETDIVRAQAENIRDFAIVLSAVCGKLTTERDGVKIEYLYAADDDPEASIETAARALACFGAQFGAYPHRSYAVAQVPFSEGGMEYGALSIIADHLQPGDHEKVIAHETAHQWFYGVVGNDPFRHAWMDEGLAEYCAYLYFREIGAYDYAAAIARSSADSYRSFLTLQEKLGEPCGGQLSKDLDEFRSTLHYVCVTYDKGFLLWQYAENLMGRETLTAALAAYAAQYRFAVAAPEDLWAALTERSPGAAQILRDWTEQF